MTQAARITEAELTALEDVETYVKDYYILGAGVLVPRLIAAYRGQQDEIERLREFAKGCIRYGGSAGDDHLCDKAREALGDQ